MKRIYFDKIVTAVGFGLAVFLVIAAGLLNWGATFAADAVGSQLEAQAITLPAETGNKKESSEVTAFFKENGEKIMTTGKQAQMYADHYLGFHLSAMPAYAAASGANRAAAAALAAEKAALGALSSGLKTVQIRVKGQGSGRESAIRSIQGAGFEITSIKDITPVPHNGCRAPKRRRV